MTPAHRDPRLLGLVALGGAAGSVLRYALALALQPAPSGSLLSAPTVRELWPMGTFAVNVTGAFALGVLLELLARRAATAGSGVAQVAPGGGGGVESPRHRAIRLAFGTGVLGGFTTWSSFALESVRLVEEDHAALAGGYMTATLIVGTAAAIAGVALGSRIARGARRTSGVGDEPGLGDAGGTVSRGGES